MSFGPKRGHPIYIFENINDFVLLFIALIIALFKGDMSIFTSNLAYDVIIFAMPFIRLVSYLTTYISVDDQKLTVRSGWLFKKHMEIPVATITTIDFSQGVFHQMLGAYKVKIDNAGNMSGDVTKISMSFGKEDATKLKELLQPGKAGLDCFNLESDGDEKLEGKAGEYYFSMGDLALMGAIKDKGKFLLQLIAIVCGGSSFLAGIVTVSEAGLEHQGARIVNSLGLIWVAVILIAGIFLLSIAAGSIGAVIKYYGFHISDSGDTIRIRYGLLTRKSYTIHKSRISGFYYEQSILMRCMKTGTLHCYAIGYGGDSSDEDTSEDPILIPLIKSAELRRTMAGILPEMAEAGEREKPLGRSWYYFLYSWSVLLSLIVLAGLIVLPYFFPAASQFWIMGLAILAMAFAGAMMQHYNTSIYGNGNNISISSGGFNKTTVFVKTRNVESVYETAGYFKHKKGVTTVVIGFIAPLATSGAKARNVSVEAFENIRNRLIY